MKHRNKNRVRIAAVLGMLILLAACGGTPQWEKIRAFEFYFEPKEYDAAYSSVSKTVELEGGQDYRIRISAQCEAGTIQVLAQRETGEEKIEIAQWQAPFEEEVSLDADSAERFSLTISIDPQTQGTVKTEIFRAAF